MSENCCQCKCSEKQTAKREVDECPNLPGPRTDEIYHTVKLPLRFMYPKIMRGYREVEGETPHPCYRRTSMDYGWFSPTVHTVPTGYYPRDYTFSKSASLGGMWRNCSLNTEMDRHPFL